MCAWWGMFRKSSLLPAGRADPPVLRLSSLSRCEDGLLLVSSYGKSNQFGRSHKVLLPQLTPGHPLCPVAALRDHLRCNRLRLPQQGLFTISGGSTGSTSLTSRMLDAQFRYWLSKAGFSAWATGVATRSTAICRLRMQRAALLGSWLRPCLIASDLTAKLAVTVTEYPIQSVEDLVSMPHYKAMAAQGTNIYATIMLATDGPMAALRKQMVAVDTMTTCAETPLQLLRPDADPYLVCISNKSTNSFYASTYCRQVYPANSYFNYYYQAMTFPMDAYYLPAFDRLMQRGKESGIVDVVTRKWVPQTSDCGGNSAAAEAAAIPLMGVGGAYILSLGLYVGGGLILLLELFWVVKLGKQPLDMPGY